MSKLPIEIKTEEYIQCDNCEHGEKFSLNGLDKSKDSTYTLRCDWCGYGYVMKVNNGEISVFKDSDECRPYFVLLKSDHEKYPIYIVKRLILPSEEKELKDALDLISNGDTDDDLWPVVRHVVHRGNPDPNEVFKIVRVIEDKYMDDCWDNYEVFYLFPELNKTNESE